MALYIVVSVLFGVMIGFLYARAKNSEENLEKEQKQFKVINDKNEIIMRLKNELRSLQRKVDAINQGYDLQAKLLTTKEKELNNQEQTSKKLQELKAEYRKLSIELSEKIKIIDDKDEIITLLENKIKQVTNESESV
jgi:CHASE3 domain sensor protein